jgi:hypothetical protein
MVSFGHHFFEIFWLVVMVGLFYKKNTIVVECHGGAGGGAIIMCIISTVIYNM